MTDFYHPDLPYGRGTEVCGAQYQEGSPGSEVSCACGTFAIGRCGNCGAPACGRHSKLDETQTLICGACRELVAGRHEQESRARLAALPTAGIPQLLGLRRGELDVVTQLDRICDGSVGSLVGNKGRGRGQVGDDGDIYVVRSMQGKALAHFLRALNAQPDFTVVKKHFGREERVDQGWVIWSYTPKYDGGSDAPVGAPNIAPSDYYNMLEDGTVEKRVPRYGSRGEEAFAVTEVVSADWYWSPSVVWQVYFHLWRYPNEPFRVRFESTKLPLYAERPDAWA